MKKTSKPRRVRHLSAVGDGDEPPPQPPPSLYESEAWQQLARAHLGLIRLARDTGDPLVNHLARVVMATTVAAGHGDARTLEEWARSTLPYVRAMEGEQLLLFGLEPIKGKGKGDEGDRVAVLRRLVGLARSQVELLFVPATVGDALAFHVQNAFPSLRPASQEDLDAAGRIVAARYQEMREWYNHKKLLANPEWLVVEALVALGLPRETAHGWMKVV